MTTTSSFDPARVTVFCGSARGHDERHAALATSLGEALVRRGLGLVTGGGSVGLMGVVADAVLARGGEVIGVIPRRLYRKEIAHEGLTKLHVVETMHDRKALLGSLGGAFIALPGGMGTLEELFEVLTWAQLGYHGKPIGLLDPGGYYATLEAFLDHAVGEGFVRPEHRLLLHRAAEPDALLDELARGHRGTRLM
jgi:uncharacterized protein (TIGR00730 family)